MSVSTTELWDNVTDAKGRVRLDHLDSLRTRMEELERERDEARAIVNELHEWLEEACEALGADDVFGFKAAGARRTKTEAVIEAARHLNLETTSYSDGGRGSATAVRIHYGTWERLQAALATLDQEEEAPAP